jgi:hypothetical protein
MALPSVFWVAFVQLAVTMAAAAATDASSRTAARIGRFMDAPIGGVSGGRDGKAR